MTQSTNNKTEQESLCSKLPAFCMGSLYLAVITWVVIYAMTES